MTRSSEAAGNEKGPRASAALWAIGALGAVILVGAPAFEACARSFCLSHSGGLRKAAYFALVSLSLPWLLIPPLGKIDLRGWGGALLLSSSAGASLGLIVFFARLWYLQFRSFLAKPLPVDWLPEPQDQERFPSPRRSKVVVHVFVGGAVLTLIFVVLKYGFTLLEKPAEALGAFGSIVVLTLIPFYFELRRSQKPNKLEVALAFTWILVRRTTVGFAALLFAVGAVAAYRGGSVWSAIGLLFMSATFFWWGWFGPGYGRGYGDDLPAHRARKRRYGWK